MILLAVNYHYIDEEDRFKRGIYPISPKHFSSQLDALSTHFTFISQHDLLDALSGVRRLPESACIITFDDGLSCQFERALPILNKKGVPAIFFVTSAPYTEEGTMLLVHKIHWLMAHLSPEEFRENVIRRLKEALTEDPILYLEKITREARIKYRYDDAPTAALKYLLNRVLDYDTRKSIVDDIWDAKIQDHVAFSRAWYLTKDQIAQLAKVGYLGIHSHDHAPLIGSASKVKREIMLNKATIEEIAGNTMYGISYPYGSRSDVNIDAVSVYKELGLRFGFTMERAFNNSLLEPFLLARASTNDVPGGATPLFHFKGGRPVVTGDFSLRRAVFFSE